MRVDAARAVGVLFLAILAAGVLVASLELASLIPTRQLRWACEERGTSVIELEGGEEVEEVEIRVGFGEVIVEQVYSEAVAVNFTYWCPEGSAPVVELERVGGLLKARFLARRAVVKVLVSTYLPSRLAVYVGYGGVEIKQYWNPQALDVYMGYGEVELGVFFDYGNSSISVRQGSGRLSFSFKSRESVSSLVECYTGGSIVLMEQEGFSVERGPKSVVASHGEYLKAASNVRIAIYQGFGDCLLYLGVFP